MGIPRKQLEAMLGRPVGRDGVVAAPARQVARPSLPEPVGGVVGFRSKTEAAYARALDMEQRAGLIRMFRYEPFKLRLAAKTFYTPDFLVVQADGRLQAHEVKGFWHEDARVKIKVAAELFPMFEFVAVQRADGRWVYEHFKGAWK